ncbi:MAG: DNA polymerase III subunit delta [Verrucomicrobiota bacterium]|nr:DNA polymerase III subunit delta [Verrucomicrobiota bacterium]
MPAREPAVVLICGDDEFAVKERAKKVFGDWQAADPGLEQEIIAAGASNGAEALKAMAKLREALQTLPFFGTAKAVWLRDCNFLGDERAASAQAVTQTLNDLGNELKNFEGFKRGQVRLLISAGKADKRRSFYKTLEKIGGVETFAALSADDKDWADRAEAVVRAALRQRRKEIGGEALSELVNRIGPNPRQLDSEVEKLCLWIGERQEIEFRDVAAICSRNKTARAFALGDALGDRDLPRLLKRLDEELWEMKSQRDGSAIGLLYGMISKIRAMLLLKEMLQEGLVRPTGDYNQFKAQLERVPRERLPADKRFNPLAINPYVLYKALPQVDKYRRDELIQAMDLLLLCNRRLVGSGLDATLLLQQTLAQIAAPRVVQSGGIQAVPV